MRPLSAHAGIGIFLAFTCVVAGLRFLSMPHSLPEEFVSLLETKVILTGIIVAEPDIRESTQRLSVQVSHGDAETTVLAVAQRYPHLRVGEPVRVVGTLTLPEPLITDTGRTFRYDTFLSKDGIFSLVSNAHIESLGSPAGVYWNTLGSLLAIKQLFQEGLGQALPEPAASLASGLITGGKQGLGPSLLEAFIVTGLVHIVVLSGYNVMIVAEAVIRGFGFLSHRAAAGAALLVIALFVLAAGAGAASVRAGIMAGIALLARMTGKTYFVVRALVCAACIMLMHNPFLLLYDPGFQLSFLATLGLVLGVPQLEPKLLWIRSGFLREIIATSLAAQIAVLPLLLYQSGLFSVVSIPANIAVLPVVPLAMALSALASPIALLVPIMAPVVGFPAHIVLTYIIESARFFATLPGSSLSLPEFPFVLVILSYVLLGAQCVRFMRKTGVPNRYTGLSS